MNNAQMAKIFGWAQFGIQTAGQVLGAGIPTTVMGWVALIGSLLTAVGVHTAASTDGAK